MGLALIYWNVVPEKYHVLEQDTDMTRALAQLEQTSISNGHNRTDGVS